MANPVITAKIALDIADLQQNLKAGAAQTKSFSEDVKQQLQNIKVNVDTGQLSGASKEFLDTINRIKESAKAPVTLAGFAESFKQANTSAQELLSTQKQALAQLIATGQTGGAEYQKLVAATRSTKEETERFEAALRSADEALKDVVQPTRTQVLQQAFGQMQTQAKSSFDEQRQALAQLVASGQAGSAEYLKLVSSTKAAKEETEKFEKALKQADEALKDVAQPTRVQGLQQAFAQTQTSAKTALDEQRQALAQLVLTGDKGSEEYKKLVAETNRVAKETREFDAALKQVDADIDNVGKKENPFGKLFQFNQVTQAVNTVAAELTGLTKPFVQYESDLAALSAVTGITGDGLNELGARGQALAVQFGGSVSSQMKSFQGIISKFGPAIANSPEGLGSMAESVNLLSKAGGIDAATAMGALTDSMVQFGVDTSNPIEAAKEMAKFTNVMAASAQVGSAEINQVADSILVAGSALNGANVSFEESNAAIQVIGGKIGQYGSQAGTSIRNVLGYLQKNTTESKKLFENLGLSFDEIGKVLTTQGLEAAMKLVGGAMDKLGSDAEKNAAFMTVFGVENAGAARALAEASTQVDASGKTMFGSFTEGVTGTTSAVSQAATNMDTTAGAIDRLKAKIEVGLVKVFDAVGPAVTGALNGIAEIAPTLTSLTSLSTLIPDETFDSMKEAASDAFGSVKAFAKDAFFSTAEDGSAAFKGFATIGDELRDTMKGKFGAVSEVVSNFGSGVKSAVSAAGDSILSSFTQVDALGKRSFVGLGQSLKNVGGSIKDIALNLLKTLVPSLFTTATASGAAAAGIGVATGATTASGVAAGGAAASFGAMWGALLGPVALVIGAVALVGGAIYLLYQNSETVRNAIDAVIAAVVEIGTGIFEVVKAIGGVLLEAGKLIFDFLIAPFELLFTVVSTIFSAVADIIGEAFGVFGDTAGDVEDSGSIITDVFNAIVGAIQFVGKFLAELGGQFNAWKQVAVEAIKSAIDNMKPVIETVVAAFTLFYGALIEVAEFLGGLWLTVIQGVIDIVIELASIVIDNVVAAFNQFVDVVTVVATAIADFVGGAFEALKSAFDTVVTAIKDFISQFGFLKTAANGVVSVFGSLIAVVQNVGGPLEFVKGILGGLGGAFEVVREAVQTFFTALKNLDFDSIGATFDGLLDRILGGFKSGFSKATEKEIKEPLEKAAADAGKVAEKTTAATTAAVKAGAAAAIEQIAKLKREASTLTDDQVKERKKEIEAVLKEELSGGKIQQAQYKTLSDELDAIGKKADNSAAERKAKALEEFQKLEQKAGAKAVADELERKKAEINAARAEEVKKATELAKTSGAGQERLNNVLANINAEHDRKIQELDEAAAKKSLAEFLKTEEQKLKAALDANKQRLSELKGTDSAALKQRLALEEDALRLQEELELVAAEGSYEKSLEIIARFEQQRQTLSAEANAKIAALREREEIEAITDLTLREKELRLLGIRQAYEKELEAAGANQTLQLEAYRKYHQDRRKVEEEFAKDSRSLLASFASFTEAFNGGLAKKQDEQAREETKKKKAELDKQLSDLQDQQKQGLLTYEQFQEKFNDIERQKTDVAALEGGKRNAIEAALAEGSRALVSSLTAPIIEEENKRRAKIAELSQNTLQKKLELGELESKFHQARAEGDAEAEEKAYKKIQQAKADLGANDTEMTELMKNNSQQLLISAGATFANLIAQGENAGKAIVLVAFDTLQGLVPVLTAQIFGQSFAQLGPIGGAIATGVITAGFQGLIGLAKASLGFKDGVVNLRGPGTTTSDSIPARLSLSESVITAQGTLARGRTFANSDILTWINKTGRPIEDYPGFTNIMTPRISREAMTAFSVGVVGDNSAVVSGLATLSDRMARVESAVMHGTGRIADKIGKQKADSLATTTTIRGAEIRKVTTRDARRRNHKQ